MYLLFFSGCKFWLFFPVDFFGGKILWIRLELIEGYHIGMLVFNRKICHLHLFKQCILIQDVFKRGFLLSDSDSEFSENIFLEFVSQQVIVTVLL